MNKTKIKKSKNKFEKAIFEMIFAQVQIIDTAKDKIIEPLADPLEAELKLKKDGTCKKNKWAV
ncbi:MAG: hypothetical protein IIB83_03770 [Bacteroidetes bacterium]|nr:hypothetical protein [Bacteroidota bacterium]